MEDKNQDNELEKSSDFEFLQEKIKERPINKKKLLRRTLITISMALLFGLVACLTFLLMEPVLNNWIYPEEEPQTVTFPQDKNEMLPEDMLTEGETGTQDTSAEAQESSSEVDTTEPTTSDERYVNPEEVAQAESETEQNFYLSEQQMLYQQLYNLYKEISTSMVTVTGVTSDVDWFNNIYENEGNVAGVIIANNQKELLILSRKAPLDDAEYIRVTFCNGVSAEGTVKGYDGNTDLAVIAVDLKNVNDDTLSAISLADLGNSVDKGLTVTPVIAVGNIQGYKDNVCFGMVTSTGNVISLADNAYKLLTTDIYASQSPSGVLVNMDGQVIGIIDNSYNHEDTKNLLSAIGISELKGMITKISNGDSLPYIGLYTQDISSDTRDELGLPQGAYISDIDMDSPAMTKGIQKGDILVQVGDKEVRSVSEYVNALRSYPIGDELKIVVLRASKSDYEEMEFTLVPIDTADK